MQVDVYNGCKTVVVIVVLRLVVCFLDNEVSNLLNMASFISYLCVTYVEVNRCIINRLL